MSSKVDPKKTSLTEAEARYLNDRTINAPRYLEDVLAEGRQDNRGPAEVMHDERNAGPEVVEVESYEDLHVPELQEELEARDLPKTGNKAELVARLVADDKAQAD